MKRNKKKVYTVGIAYPSHRGDLPDLYYVVHKSLLDFRKENILILQDEISSSILRINYSLSTRNNGFGY